MNLYRRICNVIYRRSARERLVADIKGCLKQTIHNHGPIEGPRIGSALKRVRGSLRGYYVIRKPSNIIKELMSVKHSQDCRANRKWRSANERNNKRA